MSAIRYNGKNVKTPGDAAVVEEEGVWMCRARA